MQKILLMGCMCLGGLMLTGSEGSCLSLGDSKKSSESDLVRVCKAYFEILLPVLACSDDEDWTEADLKADLQSALKECEEEDSEHWTLAEYIMEYGIGCTPDVSTMEACAEAVKAAGKSCAAREKAEAECPDWCE